MLNRRSDICILYDTAGLGGYPGQVFEEYRSGLSGLCDVFAVNHKRNGGNGGFDRNRGVIDLTDDQIFAEISHRKDITKGLIPGNPDLKILRAIEMLPEYSGFIRIEYDVHCVDDLAATIARLIEVVAESDFAASFITPWRNDNWVWWNSLVVPADQRNFDQRRAVRAFLPIVALSRRFAEIYRTALDHGWAGHYEVLMATIAAWSGVRMTDLSEPGLDFTHYPQFAIQSVSRLEEAIPAFIHPIKSAADRQAVEATITALRSLPPALPALAPAVLEARAVEAPELVAPAFAR